MDSTPPPPQSQRLTLPGLGAFPHIVGASELGDASCPNTIIDLDSEVLIDRSEIRNPHLRLLLTALGQELQKDRLGSPSTKASRRITSR